MVRHCIRTIFAVSLLLCVGALSQGMAPASAAGAASCSSYGGNYPHFFDGGVAQPGGATQFTIGTAADITVQPGVFCQPLQFGNYYSGWAMVTSSSVQDYAQAGFDNTIGNSNYARHFAQYTDLGLPISNFTQIQAQIAPYHYSVVYDTGCSCLKMYVGSLELLQMSYNALYWPLPMGIQMLGEVGNYTDGQPGAPFPNTAHWSNILTQIYGGNWQPVSVPTSINQNTAMWGLNGSHACGPYFSQFCTDIWTN
jgi:hypothetical protein